MPRAPRRLGVVIDAEYARTPDGRVRTGEVTLPFLRFAAEVARHAGGLVLLGRAAPSDRPDLHSVPAPADLVALPPYPDLTHVHRFAATVPAALRATWRGLDRIDVLWLFGPHPMAVPMALLALARRRRVVLGVRQDSMAYFRSRLPGPRWRPLLAPIWLMDRAFRLLGRVLPVTAVGTPLAAQYGHPSPRVLPFVVALTGEAEFPGERERAPGGTVRLLTVGRLAVEKAPEVLVDALALLARSGRDGWRAEWVGTGPRAEAVARRAAEAGLDGRLALAGYVPFGPRLLDRYREADVFVHTAVTEGVPQVLVEAMAAGCAVVATDVGGVRDLVADGVTGLLVPPADPRALAAAVGRVVDDAALRARLSAAARERARGLTREAEAARVARFVLGGHR